MRRKQVYELTAADLQATPVWEHALDEEGTEGQDEATVRPYEVAPPLDSTQGMFVARARFTLADGTQHVGYLTPPVQGDASIATLQPVIVSPRGQVMFWYGVMPPPPEALRDAYAKLEKSAAQVFPLRFESDVAIAGGPVRGQLDGFVRFRSFTDRTVVATS
jgi:hypothetical protein